MNSFKKANLDKFFCEQIHLQSTFYNKEDTLSILVASDLHYQPNVDKELYKILIKYIREITPDYVVIPGDIIETISFIDIEIEKEFFESFLMDIAKVCPVIIVPGNHEIGNFDIDKYTNRNYTFNEKAINYLESLNRFENIYFLNNKKIKINNITFLGFNPRLATYLKYKDKKTNDMFVEDYLNSGLKMDENDYNILITHSSMFLEDEGVVNSIDDFKKTDLVISGHWHDGYLPKFLDKHLEKTDVGLFFTPLLFPNIGIWCRGIHNFGRGYVFVSQGFRKYTTDISIFNALEKITANDVENLIIKRAPVLKKSVDIIKTRPYKSNQ